MACQMTCDAGDMKSGVSFAPFAASSSSASSTSSPPSRQVTRWADNAGFRYSEKEAHVLLDDLLSLTDILFNLFQRCDEIDYFTYELLADYFQDDNTRLSSDESALIKKARSYDNQAWTRMSGTVLEPVE
jgi:hypothetical protein